jgi:DNA-binding SARP family transcriptional activator
MCHPISNLTEQVKAKSALRIQTLGGFRVWCDGLEISPAVWERQKALHLFQFLITTRNRYYHKEQLIDRLWPELDPDAGDRDFRVALNAVHRALEPERPPRREARFIQRQGLAYRLNLEETWVDADEFEALVRAGNLALPQAGSHALACYQQALALYAGEYLPECRYEDWASAEQERLQLLALGTMIALAELLTERSPLESLRLTQQVLSTDPIWEDAYRTQMRAYMALGNRPLALRTYQQCVNLLEQEFAISPLPETQALYERIRSSSL